MTRQRALGAPRDAHQRDAATSAGRARSKLDAVERALRQRDCEGAWDALVFAAQDIGAAAAHQDSIGSTTTHLRLPPDDEWVRLQRRLATLADAGRVCFRRESSDTGKAVKSFLGRAVWKGIWTRPGKRK